jgi:starvation-inducible outer membrane lipoprotein
MKNRIYILAILLLLCGCDYTPAELEKVVADSFTNQPCNIILLRDQYPTSYGGGNVIFIVKTQDGNLWQVTVGQANPHGNSGPYIYGKYLLIPVNDFWIHPPNHQNNISGERTLARERKP